MFSNYGVRTLDTGNGAYWPLRYHSGSVWALSDLAKAAGEAALLAAGLVDAAEIFDYRLPELFSGTTQPRADPSPTRHHAARKPGQLHRPFP